MPKKKKNKKKERDSLPSLGDKKIPEEIIEGEIREIAPELEEKQVKKVAQIVSYSVSRMVYFGPLPPPEDFKKYEEILPGAAKRILSMAERQSSHRQSLQKEVVPSEIKKSYLGMVLGFILGISAITFGFILLLKNRDAAGLAIIIAALCALVSVFIVGRGKEEKELK